MNSQIDLRLGRVEEHVETVFEKLSMLSAQAWYLPPSGQGENEKRDGVDVDANSDDGGMGVAGNSEYGSSPDRSRVVSHLEADDSTLVPRSR